MFKSLSLICLFLLPIPLIYADDAFSVQIEPEQQLSIALTTQVLVNTQYTPELTGFATRVNLTPLLNTRQQYLKLMTEQAVAEITLDRAQQNTKRIASLHRNNATSIRKLLDQQSQLKIAQTKHHALQQQITNLRLQTRSTWGDKLSQQFLSKDSAMLDTLNKSLYLVYLPPNIKQPSTSIAIAAFGLRESAQQASLLAPAFNYANTQQTQQIGTPFFYLTETAQTPAQQRAAIWIPLPEQTLNGVSIPSSALVWHLGQAFVYLQINDELFKRIKITHKKLIDSSTYFIQDDLQEGDKLVISGAQMLLSEEFRNQIPTEDDDDDDDD